MPTLDWIGKKAVVNHHNEVPYKTLELQYTYKDGKKILDCDESENMIIHGDNLEALKALLPKYEGKVNCIYIDPPYNTGNEGWCYNDNVNAPQIQKWLGETVGKEAEDLTRHDKWLCMMYPRLKMLHKLMATDGVIAISIDDNEHSNLRQLCDEIFGVTNFIMCITWRRTDNQANIGKIAKVAEYIYLYAKNISTATLGRLSLSDKAKKEYRYSDAKGFFRRGILLDKTRGRKFYPKTTKIGTVLNGPWMVSEEEFDKLDENDEIYWTTEGDGQPYTKIYLNDSKGQIPNNFWGIEFGTNQRASIDLENIFGKRVFDFPKPYSLVENILQIGSLKHNAIILDSFAGSGTTAHAVLDLNKQDGGNRKFILVEMEDYAETVTAERVKRVIDGYPYKGKKEEEIYNQELTIKNLAKASEFIEEANTIIEEKKEEYDKISNPKIVDNCIKVIGTKVYDEKMDGLGGDFSFYELGEPLMNESGFINENQSLDRIQEYIWYTETHSPFKKNGKNGEYHLGIFNDVSYYFYYEKDRITTLDASFLNEEIKTKADQYIIYADNCLLSDELLKRFNIVFKKIPRDIRQF